MHLFSDGGPQYFYYFRIW